MNLASLRISWVQGMLCLTPEGIEAIFALARTEGIITDPGVHREGFSGLWMADVRNGLYDKDDVVVFLHTGGTPANFAYVELFWKGI